MSQKVMSKSKGPISQQEDFEETPCPSYLKRVYFGDPKKKKDGYEQGDYKTMSLNDGETQYIVDNLIFDIYCEDCIQYVSILRLFMEECYRILIPRGQMIVIAPYWSTGLAWSDPAIVNRIADLTFHHFNKEWLKKNGKGDREINCDFEIVNYRYYFDPDWDSRADEARKWALKHYINVVRQVEVTLRAIK